MKLIISKALKIAYPSVDDQINFTNRDQQGEVQNIYNSNIPDNQEDIKKRFKKKKIVKIDKIKDEMPKGSI